MKKFDFHIFIFLKSLWMKNNLLQKNSQQSSELLQKHLLNGKKMEKSKPLKQKEVIDDTFIMSQNKMLKKNKDTYTQESLHQNNCLTYKDKFHSLKKIIPTIKLSKTLDQELILKEKDSLPFWKKSLQDKYQKLWLPTETDLQDLELISSSTSLNVLKYPLKSYQMLTSKNLQQNSKMTSYQSLQFSQQDIMVPDHIKYTKKIRFYPNIEQLELLNKCVGSYRFFYNKALSFLKSQMSEEVNVKFKIDEKPLKLKCKLYVYKKPKNDKLISFNITIKYDPDIKPISLYLSQDNNISQYLKLETLRPLIIKSDKELDSDDPMIWQKEIPYDTRQEAISDVITAYKGCLTKLKSKQIHYFNLKYKSKKSNSEIFRVNKKAINLEEMSLFSRRLKNKKYFRVRKRDKKKLLNGIDGNFIILKTKPNCWYFCLPREKKTPIFENTNYKSVFLDPGVRTFQTLYSPDGLCGKIKAPHKLEQLAKKHDLLWSISDQKIKSKKNLRLRCAIIRNKIKNIIENLHWSTCHFLCNHFQTIFLPEFKVSDMVKDSPLGHKITRRLLQLSHGKFRERLKYYAITKHRNLYIITEEYTTKTCGHCGHLQDMEGKKVYDCSSCGTMIDRDYNGARNICLKMMTYLI